MTIFYTISKENFHKGCEKYVNNTQTRIGKRWNLARVIMTTNSSLKCNFARANFAYSLEFFQRSSFELNVQMF